MSPDVVKVQKAAERFQSEVEQLLARIQLEEEVKVDHYLQFYFSPKRANFQMYVTIEKSGK
jgi:hypothetical protein